MIGITKKFFMTPFIKLLRPRHWLKNLFVFVPIFFAREIFELTRLEKAGWTFFVFCLVASAVYIINDIVDRKADALHPQKKHRPLASGKIKVKWAAFLSLILFVLAGFIVYRFVPAIVYVIIIYVVLNLVYSLYLKNQAIFDVLLISGLYLVRVIGGGIASSTPISSWLILCTLFLTLFLILGKRKAEMIHTQKRKVLGAYNPLVLDHLLTVSVGLTLISYSLYCVLGVDSPYAVFSIFFVLLAMFRYLHLTYSAEGETETPEKVVMNDQVILGSIIGWIIFMFIIFY